MSTRYYVVYEQDPCTFRVLVMGPEARVRETFNEMKAAQVRENEANQKAHDEKQARFGLEPTPCPSLDTRVLLLISAEG